MPRTVAAHLALPPAVDQATAVVPDQIDPNGAFLCSSQYLVMVLRRPIESTQFTSPRFTGVLEKAGVRISMDGRGRWMDNVFIERLWRSLKYECVYLRAFETGSELRAGLTWWIGYYNSRRPHSTLAGRSPDDAYWAPETERLAA